MNNAKMKVGVVGATGMVGQRFLTLLHDHPYFEVAALAAYLCSEDCSYVTGTVINCAGAECTSS